MDDSNSIKDSDFLIMEDFVKGISNGFDLNTGGGKSNISTRLGYAAELCLHQQPLFEVWWIRSTCIVLNF
jgi:hypothetical protein